MLDHLALDVTDYERGKAFYRRALALLGISVVMEPFRAGALAAGTNDNGGPVREIYHPNYYGAFLLDPDGDNVEAICHTPG